VFDQVHDLDVIMRHVDTADVCVQAGGACGIWPAYLARIFDTVYTFEPDPLNFQCLEMNAPTVHKHHAALGARPGSTTITRHDLEQSNCGAGYVTWDNGEIPVVTIDDVIPSRFSLLLLDVEGAEYDALLGGSEIIQLWTPTIVIEEKSLPQGGDHLRARGLLESWGYKERGRVHKDVIFEC
jgi:FkbM family methyltransferase